MQTIPAKTENIPAKIRLKNKSFLIMKPQRTRPNQYAIEWRDPHGKLLDNGIFDIVDFQTYLQKKQMDLFCKDYFCIMQ